MIEGIDYAWGRPRPELIKGGGWGFVVRYLSHDITGKTLTRAEAQALNVAGLWVVCVFEDAAARPLSGYSAGHRDATFAAQQALDCGMPPGRPIYFAADWDVLDGQMPLTLDYLRGAAAAIGRSRVGVYGGLAVVRAALDAQVVDWGWQTYAWSGSAWDPRAQLRQYSNDHILDGVSVDYCRSTADDFGQWMIGRMPDVALTSDEIDKIAIAVLNRDGLIKAPDGSTANPFWALKTIVYDTARNVRELLARPAPAPVLSDSDVGRIADAVISRFLLPDAQMREIIEALRDGQPQVDHDRIISGVLDGLAARMRE